MDAARERSLQRLVTSLEELTKLYRQLHDLVAAERELLLGARLEELALSNETKDGLLLKIRLADAARLKAAEEMAAHVGADAANPRLLAIAELLGTEGNRLRGLHATLETLLTRVSEMNKGNEEHARTALRTLNGAMNDIKETLSGKKTYERKGHYKLGPETTGNFVRKEA
ncbi:MAG: flagellar export chaperone FlgN [Bdellovibrionaceae bacterium]|nr:flagellar export chaperone FlgN [Pseudobdellovibrionaceae bacterium]MBX3032789.1 flagellar export chaperone FlgN [Pseudobdellovibrionaceae bacterium]